MLFNVSNRPSLMIANVLLFILALLVPAPIVKTDTINNLGFPFGSCQTWYVWQGYSSGTHTGLFQYAFDLVVNNRNDAIGTAGAEIVAAASGQVTSIYPITGPKGQNWGRGIKIKLSDNTLVEYDHLMNVVVSTGQNVVTGTPIGQVFDGRPGGVNHLHFQLAPTQPLTFGVWNYPSNGPSDGNGVWSGSEIKSNCPPQYKIPDYNNDGKLDLYAISKQDSESGKTAVHILNGADNFQSFLLSTATALPATGSDGEWMFALGDYNGDNKLDLYAISKQDTGSGKTAIHVLNGADNFQSFLLSTATALHSTGSDGQWMFTLGDYNNDKKPDLYAINKRDAESGRTAVHVLNGADNFQNFLLSTATILPSAGSDCSWTFPQSQCGFSSLNIPTPSQTTTAIPTATTTATPTITPRVGSKHQFLPLIWR